MNTHRADEADDRLSLILFRYSDGLIKWFEPSDVPLGKLGGTNGKTSCLFTKFGPFERAGCPVAVVTETDDDAEYCAWYVWYSSDDEALPPPLLCWCCTDDVVPLISRAFLFAAEMDVYINKPTNEIHTTVYHLKYSKSVNYYNKPTTDENPTIITPSTQTRTEQKSHKLTKTIEIVAPVKSLI